MRRLSTFQLALLISFGSLAVAGVLVFALAVGGPNVNTVGAVTVWGPLDRTAFATVIRQVAENNAQLSQVTYVQKDPTTYETDLLEALASNTGPDLFLIRQDYVVKDANKIAAIPSASLSESQFQNTFIDAASPFLSPNGVLGVPLFADPLVLYWNKDMLANAGFSQPPRYWDEFFTLGQKISTRNDTGGIVKSAVALGEYKNIDNAKDILATLILQAGGTITAIDNTGHLTPAFIPKTGSASQSTVSALRFYTEFADSSKSDYSWNRSLPQASVAFTSGDLALYIGYASEAPFIERKNPNLNFAIAPIPQIRSATRASDTARVYALAASRAGKNPANAITVAYLLAATDIAQALSSALGIPSARRDVVGAKATGNDDLFNKMAIISHSWIDPDPVATGDIFRAMIEQTTSGSALLSEAVSRADQTMAHLLGL
jgi:ABC-type glycerol-3-phosphate transport system substrate-binding protein